MTRWMADRTFPVRAKTLWCGLVCSGVLFRDALQYPVPKSWITGPSPVMTLGAGDDTGSR
jgi:hypothetical protein